MYCEEIFYFILFYFLVRIENERLGKNGILLEGRWQKYLDFRKRFAFEPRKQIFCPF